jgi:CxxC-x17-CxxC domain-containing protein
MSLEDKTLTCADCGATFVFTASEQAFFQSKGYTNDPKRCPACREARKAQRQGGDGYASKPQRQMFTVTCDACGKEAQVPFEPREGRPVYCSDCFTKIKDSQPK